MGSQFRVRYGSINKTSLEVIVNSKRNMLKKIAGVGVTSIVLPNAWVKPIIRGVVLPAHAQTSCADILDVSVEGKWRFTATNGIQFLIILSGIDGGFANIAGNTLEAFQWKRNEDGTLTLLFNERTPGRLAIISKESNCIASELTYPDKGSEFAPGPLVAIRI